MPTEEIADSRATYQKALEEKHKKNECGNFAIDLSLCLFDVKVELYFLISSNGIQ